MDEKLKQRLIGGLVIAGSLCIILPFLFYNSRPSADQHPAISTAPAASIKPPVVSVALPTDNATAENAAKPVNANEPAAPSSAVAAQNQPAAQLPSAPTAQATPSPAQPQKMQMAQNDAQAVQPVVKTTPATPSIPEHKFNSNTIATHPEAAAAGFKPDQAVSPSSGLTTGAPISSLPASMGNPTASAPPSPAQLESKPEAASSDHARSNHVVAHHHAQSAAHHHYAHEAAKGQWEIQLAVFSDKHNAHKLIAQLHRKHIPAFARTILHHGRHMTAVFAGPESTHGKTLALQSRLHHELRMAGMIKRA